MRANTHTYTKALWVIAAAWVLEGRHCGRTGLSGSIKWPSHGSPLAWVVRLRYWCVCWQGRTYIHPAKVRWVSVCGGKGWQDSLGSAHTWSATSPADHPIKHTHPTPIHAEQIFWQRRVDGGASPLSNWVTSGVRLGSAQDGLAVPKQDLRKPQPLLESISPPSHQPPTPPQRLWRQTLTLNHQTAERGGQQIPWVSKLWPKGKK